MDSYNVVKSLHVIFLVSWFAGLFYLPRILVNLAMVPAGEERRFERERLVLMGQKLYRFMGILMVGTLVFGFMLWLGYGVGMGPGSGWMHAKLTLVVVLIGYHHIAGAHVKKFERGLPTKSHVWYRWFNEVPVVALTGITFLVLLKPF